MFDRGHLDHLALTVASPEAFEALRRFHDRDGMQVELVVVVDPELRGIHEPRPLDG
jgi:hypothetical protein